MSNPSARQEAKRQLISTNSPITINATSPDKKDCLHILHVDDDISFLEISKQILSMDNNFEITIALSVDEAFKKMEYQQFDAVVSDYEMPQKNGLEFLKELREQNNQIPFILFTGKGREDVAVKALNLDADSYLNKNGSPETVYCELAHAINKTAERKKSVQLLAVSESKYRLLVEKSLQGILVTKAAPLRLVFANDAMGKILGYSPQELMSLSPEGIMGLVWQEDRAIFFKRMENRLRGQPADASYEFRAVRKDNSIIWLKAFANRIDYDGQLAVQGMFLDVTESKKAGEILRESEQRYRELANFLPDIVFETDLNGRLEFANERAAQISGYPMGEIEKGLNILQFIVPEDRERAIKNIQRLLLGGSYVPAEYTFLRKDGTTFSALITATPRILKNKMTGLRGIVLDISERKKIEEALSESEEKFRKAFLTSPDAVYIGTLDEGKILDTNEHFEEVFGYTRQESIGKTSLELGLWTNPTDRREIVSKLRSGGKVQNLEVFGTRKNGQIFPLQISMSVVEANEQQLILGVIRDVSNYKKSEETMRKSEARYRELANFLPEIVFETDLSGKMTFFSQKAFEITGYTSEELEKGMNMLQFVVPQEREKAKENIKKALSGEDREGHEYTLYKKNGATYPAIVKTAPIISENKVSGLRGLVIDVTDLKKNEEKMLTVSLYSRSLIEASLDPLVTIDIEGKITDVNKATEEATGFTREELIGSEFLNYFTEPEKAQAGYRKVFTENCVRDYPLAIRHKSGKITDVIYNASVYRNSQGTIQGVFAAARDITESKKRDAILRQNEEQFRQLFSSMPSGVAVYEAIDNGEDFVFRNFNSAAEKIENLTKNAVLSKRLTQVFEGVRSSGIFEVFQRVWRTGQQEYCPVAFYKDDKNQGSWRENWVYKLPNGNIIAIYNDISERMKADFALRQEREKLESVTTSIDAGLVIISKDYHVLWENDFIRRYKGDVNGKLCYATLNSLDSPCLDCGVAKIYAEKATFDSHEYCSKDLNGKQYWVEIIASPIKDENGKVVAASELAVDITERKNIEEALKESEERSRAIVANSPIGIATSGVDKRFLSANEAFCRILGYTEEELRKLTFKDITDSGDLKESCTKICELENSKIPSFSLEKRYVKKDGTIINGKIMVSALRNQNGTPSLFIAELEDITERKKAEEHRKVLERKLNEYSEHLKYMVDLRTAQLKDANERLIKSERLAAIGELAGMVGHDLRNPLAGIKNATYYLKKNGATISEAHAKEMLEIIEKAIDHSDKIINDLLDYSREMHLELKKYEARNLVDEALGMIKVPDRIQIINRVHEETWVCVNVDKMTRVFINLIMNAVDAMPEKGTLEISSYQTRDRVEIAFADTGTGISEETLPKIFTPLFTTKAQGMGFGLAICKRIIEAHEGTITVKTAVNKGTTFTITLPIKSR